MLVDNSLSDSVHEYNMAEDGQQPQMLVDKSLSDSVHEYNMAEDGQQPQMLVDKSLSDSMHEYNMGVSFQSWLKMVSNHRCWWISPFLTASRSITWVFHSSHANYARSLSCQVTEQGKKCHHCAFVLLLVPSILSAARLHFMMNTYMNKGVL